MPPDAQAFVAEWKGKPLDGEILTVTFCAGSDAFFLALVEQVRDGTTLRVRLFMPDGEHQMVNIALAGVRSARASTKQGEPSEPWGEEVPTAFFSHLLNLICVQGKILHGISTPPAPSKSTNIIPPEFDCNAFPKLHQCHCHTCQHLHWNRSGSNTSQLVPIAKIFS